MDAVVSKAVYGKYCGVTHAAVYNWIKRGQLTHPALLSDGRIVVELADEQIARTRDPGRIGRVSRFATEKAELVADEELDAELGASDVSLPPQAQILASEPPLDKLRRKSLESLRIELAQLNVEKMERAAAVERGELVRADRVAAAWAAELSDLLIAIEQWLPDLAQILGAGRDGVDLVRREWRSFRERQAEYAQNKLDDA